jgi:hypothetical protein
VEAVKTIFAHRRGGAIRVQVVDRWHRARRSIRSMRARGLPTAAIAAALRLTQEQVGKIGLGR